MQQLKRLVSLIALFTTTLTYPSLFNIKHYTLHVGPLFNFARFKFDRQTKIEGYLAGIHADLIHKLPSHFSGRLRFDARWNAGYIAAADDRKLKINDYRPEYDISYKFALDHNKKISFMPFTGLGAIYQRILLNNELSTRTYYTLFIPLGGQITWKLGSFFDIALAGQYRADIWTRLKLSASERTNALKLSLRYSDGLLLEIPMTWHYHTHCGVKIHAKLVPFFDWNRFARAHNTNNIIIPVTTNALTEWYLGLHADLGIHF